MPRTVTQAKAPCPVEMPALLPEPWADFDGSAGRPVPFWRQPVTDAPVDPVITSQLSAWDVAFEHTAGNQASTSRPSWGIPYQLVDRTVPLTKVWNLTRGTIPWPWVNGWERLPLPDVVRREGDPWAQMADSKWRAYDPDAGRLYEAICLRWSDLWRRWELGYPGLREGLAVWDTTRPWNADGQPAGVCAAKIPYLPLVPRWDEAQAGTLGHATFCSFPNYAPGHVAPARGHDGTWSGYPLRSGDRLRLREDRFAALFTRPDLTRAERALLLGWRHYGVIVGDKWTVGSPRLNPVKVHLSQDVRWTVGDDVTGPVRRQLVTLSDFEAIDRQFAVAA